MVFNYLVQGSLHCSTPPAQRSSVEALSRPDRLVGLTVCPMPHAACLVYLITRAQWMMFIYYAFPKQIIHYIKKTYKHADL